MKKLIVVGIIILLVGMSIPSTGINVERTSTVSYDGKTLYVGGSGPGNYTRIQDAIDDASDGDTVFVYNGTYNENLIVNKTINLIGENKNLTIIDGNNISNLDVIIIYSDNVIINEFTIRNSGNKWPDDVGIDIRANNSYISNNILDNNYMGIYLFNVINCIISENNISNSSGRDIQLDFHSNNNTIGNNNLEHGISINGERNIISNNTVQGALRIDKGYNIVRDNKLKEGLDINPKVINDVDLSNSINGKPIYYYVNETGLTVPTDAAEIILVNCQNITISNYEFNHENARAIIIGLSSHILISNNIFRNESSAIRIEASSNNTIIQNEIYSCISGISLLVKSNDNIVEKNILVGFETQSWIGRGLEVVDSQRNIILTNTVSEFQEVGIWLYSDSNENKIYHNSLFNNRINAIDECYNTWDNSYPSGGNYWDDYNGTDSDGDGIGDTPYNISDGNNQDSYPLLEPFGMTILQGSVKFGLLKQELSLKNIGNHTAFNIQWSIRIDGGFLLFGRESSGNVSKPLLRNKEIVVTSNLILFGLGSIRITIDVWADNVPKDSETRRGRLFLFLLMT